MNFDKSWVSVRPKTNVAYISGLNNFLDVAFATSSKDGKIRCPCCNCVNLYKFDRDTVYEHLMLKDFSKGYHVWKFHGEGSMRPNPTVFRADDAMELDNEVHDLVHDVMVEREMNAHDGVRVEDFQQYQSHKIDSDRFYKLIKEGEVPLYPGCKDFTRLSWSIYLYHLKCYSGWSNKSVDTMLKMCKVAFPAENTCPASYQEMKKMISALSLGYEKIDACPNDCMLYWKDKSKSEVCHICKTSRWKESSGDDVDSQSAEVSKKKKKPAKVLRWFPLIPRLQRLFMSSKIAPLMTWHDKDRVKDGLLRHPADSPSWKHLDSLFPDFGSDPRNIRLGLASDGFNPFRTLSVTHSTWPVILIPYNLPLWSCMKQSNFILSLLIPGPKGPGNNVDVYLQPLIDELKLLWEVGVDTFDAATDSKFSMHAALLWTINDFPAYANLSGWSTKGRFACPTCGFDTDSEWLHHSGKFCYMGHRRWLDEDHPFRKDKASFDGNEELRGAPTPLSGDEVFEQLEDLGDNVEGPWKRKSILFTLPYWKHLLHRYNLDVMHIEKNVFDNILGTLIGQEGKSKDNFKARMDLVKKGIRSVLHPQTRPGSNTQFLPQASYQMSAAEKTAFLKILKQMKTPDEYSSNISRCVQVKQKKIIGLKSYDCHLLMQEFLPIAIRWCLPPKVCSVLIDLCNFFQDLCSKVVDESYIEELETRVAVILCEMEKIFPPSFFTVMVHLVIHLAYEVRVAGPVIYRWMYPIERFLLTLKGYVRNRACPEGSIAEGYLANECLTFCSRYLDGVETCFNRSTRNDEDSNPFVAEEDSIFKQLGRPLGRKSKGFNVSKRKRVARVMLDEQTYIQAHRYVLFNSDAVAPFIQKHKDVLRRKNRSPRRTPYQLHKLHCETFTKWFHDHVAQLDARKDTRVSEEIRLLARGPLSNPKRYTGYIVNGFRFHTKARESTLRTQNSGVVVSTKLTSYASSKDVQPVEGEVNYYGVLKDIIKLNYSGKHNIVLFRCDWVNPDRGCKIGKFGYTLVNLSHLTHSGGNLLDEPFIFASQAKKVFYIKDERDNGWLVARKVEIRDTFDMGDDGGSSRNNQTAAESDELDGTSLWVRNQDDGIDVTLEMENEHVEDPPIDEHTGEDMF